MPTQKKPTQKNQKSNFLPPHGETATVSTNMKDIRKYIEILTEFAERKLKNHFQIEKLELDNFETINSYLIYQTIKENKKQKNTLIYVPDKETKSQFYIPAIFTLALYNFIDNYLDDSTNYAKGDIIQKKGQRYEINKISTSHIELIKKDKCNTKITIKPNAVKSYIITTANLKNRQVKLKFDFYRDFFNDMLAVGDKEIPSKFKYKSVIVG